MKNCDVAEPLYREALNIQRKSEKRDTAFATTLNNLAKLYIAQAKYKDAEQLLNEALEVYEQTVGKESTLYVYRSSNLASLHFRICEYSKAEQLFLQTSEILEKLFGKDHPDWAKAIIDLGLTYQKMNDSKKVKG